MGHSLNRGEAQVIHYVREWRPVDVHQPSSSSLLRLAGALLPTGFALGLLAVIVFTTLPFLVAGALGWTARPWPSRPFGFGTRRVPTGRLRPSASGARPVSQRSA